jgi:hypothetical protein
MAVTQWTLGATSLKGRRKMEVLESNAWSCKIKVEKREEMRGEGADLQTIKGLPF